MPAIKELYPEVSAEEFQHKIVQIPRMVQFEDSDFHSGARFFLRLDNADVKPSRRGFVYVDPSRNQVITCVSVISKWGPYSGPQEPGVVTTR
jgi:hypothetical protein